MSMAFPPRTSGERPKSLVFRNPLPDDLSACQQQQQQQQQQYPTPLSPIRALAAARGPQQLPAANDVRNSLQRRFTTNALPSLAPIGEKRSGNENGEAQQNKAYNRMSLTEKRARQYEALLAQQRRIQAEMAMIDPETRREVDEAQALQQDINLFTSGILSEPGTPPLDSTAHAQNNPAQYTNRFSTSTLASPGFSARQSRPASQMTSPPSEYANPYFSTAQALPSQSVPNSERNSDHEASDDDYSFSYNNIRHKAGANPHRNSMPVTSNNFSITNFSPNLNPANTPSFPFGDEDARRSKRSSAILAASPDSRTFLALHQTDDKFPILVRRGTDSNSVFSGPITPLDMSDDHNQDPSRTDRSVAARHRQSLPPSSIRNSLTFEGSSLDGILSDATTAKNTAANRRSMDVKFSGLGDSKRPGLLVSPQKNGLGGGLKVSASYSTNDIPTLKTVGTINHDSRNTSAVHTPADETPHALPQNMPANFSKPLPKGSSAPAQSYFATDPENPYRPPQNAMQPAVQLYTGQNMFQEAMAGATALHASPPYPAPTQTQQHQQNFNHDDLPNMFAKLTTGPPMSRFHHPQQWSGHTGYGQYGPPPTAHRYNEQPQGYPTHAARRVHRDASNPLVNARLSDLKGEIYGLCKDQHGCRFLQKKLEERDPDNVQMIFEETLPHVVELMTDPFGNYLCQKLLEFANDDQRTALVRAASQFMVRIALNQHGTRALQKMIEFVNSPSQIQVVTEALQNEVVQLIQDLNGNHVIQKCLNHLKQQDVQFIINAVCHHVVIVGTHRHGCCVLQRCVDHASGAQKAQLVGAITDNIFALVQDPFGNYVVQYILDLGEPAFTEPLCRRMVGNVSTLARQKFSSNVIEKGIRTASDDLRRELVQEMIGAAELQRMLRDSFANYVVQTAMDYSDEDQKLALIEQIRPFMPGIRHTPHGRRIGTKIQEYDSLNGTGGGSLAAYPTGGPPTTYGLTGDAGVRPHFPSNNSFGGHAQVNNHAPYNGYANAGAANVASNTYAYGNGNGNVRFPAWPQMHRAGNAPNGSPF